VNAGSCGLVLPVVPVRILGLQDLQGLQGLEEAHPPHPPFPTLLFLPLYLTQGQLAHCPLGSPDLQGLVEGQVLLEADHPLPLLLLQLALLEAGLQSLPPHLPLLFLLLWRFLEARPALLSLLTVFRRLQVGSRDPPDLRSFSVRFPFGSGLPDLRTVLHRRTGRPGLQSLPLRLLLLSLLFLGVLSTLPGLLTHL
jgi:hypothetical protein